MLDGKDGKINEKLQPRSHDLSPGTRLENCSFDVAQKKVMEMPIKGLQVRCDACILQVCDHQCIVVIRSI